MALGFSINCLTLYIYIYIYIYYVKELCIMTHSCPDTIKFFFLISGSCEIYANKHISRASDSEAISLLLFQRLSFGSLTIICFVDAKIYMRPIKNPFFVISVRCSNFRPVLFEKGFRIFSLLVQWIQKEESNNLNQQYINMKWTTNMHGGSFTSLNRRDTTGNVISSQAAACPIPPPVALNFEPFSYSILDELNP